MAASEAHLDVKIFVDKETSRVLFAEAGSDFVDVLFSFMTLPLGTIVRVIGKTQSEPTNVGCFSNLYQSVKSLSNEHFSDAVFKEMLLQPRSSSEVQCQMLKINVDDTELKYFLCPFCTRRCGEVMSIYRNTKCPVSSAHSHNWSMNVVTSLGVSTCSSQVFVTDALNYIITDDLHVTPVVPGGIIGLLNNLCIKDISAIEERTVKLGLNEVLELLKLTLLSTTPLTDLFSSKKNNYSFSVPKRVSLQKSQSANHSKEDSKIDVKVVLRKSTKELLFVEAHQDFIDFLFSLLLIPLGGMLHIMDGQSFTGSLDSLYKSALSLDPKYFISEDRRNILLTPKLAPHFNRKTHLFPLESTPVSCTVSGRMKTMSVDGELDHAVGSEGFMRDEVVFFVSDNLTVTRLSAASAIAIYKRNNVSVCDLEERILSIGAEEGLSILRASLNSSSAISGGLLSNNLIFKEPKQEK